MNKGDNQVTRLNPIVQRTSRHHAITPKYLPWCQVYRPNHPCHVPRSSVRSLYHHASAPQSLTRRLVTSPHRCCAAFCCSTRVRWRSCFWSADFHAPFDCCTQMLQLDVGLLFSLLPIRFSATWFWCILVQGRGFFTCETRRLVPLSFSFSLFPILFVAHASAVREATVCLYFVCGSLGYEWMWEWWGVERREFWGGFCCECVVRIRVFGGSYSRMDFREDCYTQIFC